MAGRDIPMARLLAVAETEQAAEAIARRGAQWLVEAYVNPAKAANAVAMVTSRHDQNNGTLDPIELYLDEAWS
jgi:aspartokinase